MGDFEDESDCKLINVLEKNCNGVYSVIIHTSCLENIFSFSREFFHRKLCNVAGLSVSILFTGANSSRLAVEKNFFL